MFDKFKIIEIDVAIDFELEFSKLINVMHKLDKNAKLYKNTFYIGNTKIYDKSEKEKLNYPLTRIEVTTKDLNVTDTLKKVNNMYCILCNN